MHTCRKLQLSANYRPLLTLCSMYLLMVFTHYMFWHKRKTLLVHTWKMTIKVAPICLCLKIDVRANIHSKGVYSGVLLWLAHIRIATKEVSLHNVESHFGKKKFPTLMTNNLRLDDQLNNLSLVLNFYSTSFCKPLWKWYSIKMVQELLLTNNHNKLLFLKWDLQQQLITQCSFTKKKLGLFCGE